MSLRCLTTSILFEIFAFAAKHRIIFVVSGVGSFKHVLSKFRFCINVCRISSGSHLRDTSDSTTSRGRAAEFTSPSGGIEEVELLDYPTFNSQLHLQDYNLSFYVTLSLKLQQNDEITVLVKANQRQRGKNTRHFISFLAWSWLDGFDIKLLARIYLNWLLHHCYRGKSCSFKGFRR